MWSHSKPSTPDTQKGFSLMPDVIELWEEAAVPGENPRRQRENVLSPDTQRDPPATIKTRSILPERPQCLFSPVFCPGVNVQMSFFSLPPMTSHRDDFPNSVQLAPKRLNPKGYVERKPSPSGFFPPVHQAKRAMRKIDFKFDTNRLCHCILANSNAPRCPTKIFP